MSPVLLENNGSGGGQGLNSAVSLVHQMSNVYMCLFTHSSVALFSKVTGLEAGASYVLRIRAANEAGKGMASMASDPVIAKAVEGKFLLLLILNFCHFIRYQLPPKNMQL